MRASSALLLLLLGSLVVASPAHLLLDLCAEHCETFQNNQTGLNLDQLQELLDELDTLVLPDSAACWNASTLVATTWGESADNVSGTANLNTVAALLLRSVVQIHDDCPEDFDTAYNLTEILASTAAKQAAWTELSEAITGHHDHEHDHDHEEEEHEEEEGEHEHEHEDHALTEALTTLYYLTNLEPVKTAALNHPEEAYDEDGEGHDEHDHEEEEHDEHDHEEEEHDEHDHEEEEEHDEHDHEDDVCVAVTDLAVDAAANTTDDALVLAAPAVIRAIIENKCQKPSVTASTELAEELFSRYADAAGAINISSLQRLMDELGLVASTDDDGHDHDSEDAHDHDDHDHERRRALATSSCHNASALLQGLGVLPPVYPGDFAVVSSALVAMLESDACATAETAASSASPSNAERYGYGVLATFIVCLMSLSGAVVVAREVLTRRQRNKEGLKKESETPFHLDPLLLQGMFALAIGALAGDAILHLLPLGFGLHGHDPLSDHSDHDHGSEDLSYIGKGSIALLALYLFFLLEILLARFVESRAGHKHDHHHHAHRPVSVSDSEAMQDEPAIARSTGWLILLGDGLHNLVDGLVLGAAFSANLTTGISTTIAIVLHELPHELGDFAVLIESGWTVKRALLANFLSSLTAFIGLFIGLAVAGSTFESQQWVLSAAAGIFLYIALSDIVPELMSLLVHSKNFVLSLALATGGMWVSIGIMIVLAKYEDDIAV